MRYANNGSAAAPRGGACETFLPRVGVPCAEQKNGSFNVPRTDATSNGGTRAGSRQSLSAEREPTHGGPQRSVLSRLQCPRDGGRACSVRFVVFGSQY